MANGGMTEIGKYRIVGQIGEGAMGVVYRALDPVLNRSVAIKVMSDALARDDDLRSRFLREAQAAGSLQHPNVITIYDFGEVEGHLYIAMEFVEGDDLEDVLLRKRDLTTLQKIDIIIDVLGGLSYAHRRGIVHRDIKPANIRLDVDGRARIMDFGIAHLSSSKMTKTGIMVGTPAYMAPEQIVGGAIVPATDLFSVGAVMFELLTGKKPFAAESLQSVFYKIVSAPAPNLFEEVPGLPAGLNEIVQKALAKDPAERYTAAVDMANALTGVRPQIDSLARQSRSISLRSQIETGLATPAPAAPTQPPVAAPASGNRKTMYIAAGAGAVVVIAAAAILLRPSHKAAITDLSSSTTPAATPAAAVRDTTSAAPASGPPPAPSAPVVPSGAVAQAPATAAGSGSSKSAGKTEASGARELELFRSMQSTALDGRRRAADAGATNQQLLSGDDHNKRATSLANSGKVTDAAAQLNLATAAWFNAERDARAAAAAASSAKTRVAEQPRIEAQPPVSQPVASAPPAGVAPPQAAPAPRQAPVANPSAEIAAVVATYARAIESRDVNEVRRAFPAATTAQTNGFDQFFSILKTLRASLSINDLDVQGNTAEGRVTGAYDYVTNNGKTEHQPVDFAASFRRDGAGWKLVAIRPKL